jgi:hypothetical protein
MPKNQKKLILLLITIGGLLLAGCDSKPDNNLELGTDINKIDSDSFYNDIDNPSYEDEIKDDLSIVKETDNTKSLPGIAFVQQEYFYKEAVNVEIKSDKTCDIYYTLDGSDPDKTKLLFKDNILFKARAETKVYSVKAKGYYEDGTETNTIVHTYFVGNNADSRFNTLVFSVVTDPYNLYDYEYGIFVEGKLRKDYIAENPFAEIQPPDPANFNIRGKESEREVYLEIFEPDGTVIASQEAGIRVYGGWSRANLQKSIKIYARKEYDQINNKLRYEFFPTRETASGDGTIIDSYKRLVLRNCGNDNGFAFIRDELFQTLAGQAGYKDHHGVRPAALFINGEYRGHLWLHEVYNDEYFEEHYGEHNGSFELLEGGETFKDVDEEGSNKDAIADYEEAYALTYEDLTDDTIYNKLREAIDVENYLAYYAFQILIGNEDWPHNNYKVYRYYAAEGEEYREAPFDGKWRYLLHDLDFSYGIYGRTPWWDNLQIYTGRTGNIKEESPLFSQLLRREDCKEFFITKTLDLVNGVFAPENLNKVLDEMNQARMDEQLRMYNRKLFADWVQPDQLTMNIEGIKEYGASRVFYTINKFHDYYKLGDAYKLKVEPAKAGGLWINSIQTYSSFEGKFFPDYDTVVSAIIPAGKELDYWLVNGNVIYDTKLIINSSLVVDNNVEVVCVFKEQAENPRAIISEICSEGDKDYIMLFNPYEEDVKLMGYSLTDNRNEPGKLIMPARTIEAGQYLKVTGESNQEAKDPNMIRAGFDLREGETVTLFYMGEAIDEVKIPDLNKGSVYKRDLTNMRFYEESN